MMRGPGVAERAMESGSCWFPVRGVNAQRARAEIDDLQQAAGDHDVLEEMDHLVLIGEISMKANGSCQGEQGDYQRNSARSVAEEEQGPPAHFHGHRDKPCQLRERQSGAANVSNCSVVCRELAQAAQNEGSADHDSAEQGKIT